MTEFWSGAYLDVVTSSRWELLAVVLAVAYLILIIRENVLAWVCAFFQHGYLYLAVLAGQFAHAGWPQYLLHGHGCLRVVSLA